MTDADTDALLPRGSTAIRRDLFRDRVWTESPVRVLEADATSVVAAIWPGVVTLGMDLFVGSGYTTDDKALRLASLDALARGEWGLAEWVWKWNAFVTEVVSDRWFNVTRMYAEEDGALRCWYVNFERPPSWHAGGWDTMDLAVDLVVEPDGAWHWKDEDEYAQCRRLGIITDAEHAAVEAARDQALALVEARVGVFGVDPARAWRPDEAWPIPTLTHL